MTETRDEELKQVSKALAQERQARQDAEAALEAAERTRQDFISLVTHELRVPMTSIKGYTDLLLKGIMGPVNDAQAGFLRTIRSNVDRMSRMVSDLSDINKIEGGRLKLTFAEVTLNAALDEAVKAFNDEIEQKGQILTQAIPPDLPLLWCDHTSLIQVLGNLIGNATKYTPEGGAITIAADRWTGDKAGIHIVVRDNGIGILPEEQPRVFEKFFRASDEETRQTPGNGLALHLSRLLMELHGGRIWFESERGKGSSFHLLFPTPEAPLNG